jgi:hypothetical protein
MNAAYAVIPTWRIKHGSTSSIGLTGTQLTQSDDSLSLELLYVGLLYDRSKCRYGQATVRLWVGGRWLGSF